MRLQDYTADHRYLLSKVAEAADFADPIALDMDEFSNPVIEKAKRGPVLPIDGVLVRDWDPDFRKTWPGIHLGMRIYQIETIRFAQVWFHIGGNLNANGSVFTVVDRKDYRKFYKLALKYRREQGDAPSEPVLSPETYEALWKNTIGFLDGDRLRRVIEYGGRPKRGLLLTGPPGNGKTSACRWLWHECLKRQWEFRLVSPDSYRAARSSCDPAAAVKELFELENKGIVFFDDMDIALRDRETVGERDDQAVFLTALDGIQSTEGVVFVFTTNCRLELIDPAFRRPGRIDLMLDFPPPAPELRRRLIERWHTDIKAALDLDAVVRDTDGQSFAEIEELKNLLLQKFLDSGEWDWNWAVKQFAFNRKELNREPKGRVGFELFPSRNGNSGVH